MGRVAIRRVATRTTGGATGRNSGDAALSDLLGEELAFTERNNFRSTLGIEVVSVDAGTAVLALPVKEHLLQTSMFVHGGVLAVMIDAVIGTAVRSVLPGGVPAVTAEMNVNFIRPVKDGTIYARGQVVHPGSSLVVGSADIEDAEGRLLATGRATFFVKS